MSLFWVEGSEHHDLSPSQLKDGLFQPLDAIGPQRTVIAIPPDYTRYHSRAGTLTAYAHEYFEPALLPALDTDIPMTDRQIETMFPGRACWAQ